MRGRSVPTSLQWSLSCTSKIDAPRSSGVSDRFPFVIADRRPNVREPSLRPQASLSNDEPHHDTVCFARPKNLGDHPTRVAQSSIVRRTDLNRTAPRATVGLSFFARRVVEETYPSSREAVAAATDAQLQVQSCRQEIGELVAARAPSDERTPPRANSCQDLRARIVDIEGPGNDTMRGVAPSSPGTRALRYIFTRRVDDPEMLDLEIIPSWPRRRLR